ncbi:MAG: hypothetical protein V4686_03550 [Patescibacteria group bacterium]
MNVLDIVQIIIVSIFGLLLIGYLIAIKCWNLWTKPGQSYLMARLFFPWTSLFTHQTEFVDGYWDVEEKMLRRNCNESPDDHMGFMVQCIADAPITWDLYKIEYVVRVTAIWPLKLLFCGLLLMILLSIRGNRPKVIQDVLQQMKDDTAKRKKNTV